MTVYKQTEEGVVPNTKEPTPTVAEDKPFCDKPQKVTKLKSKVEDSED